MSNNLTDHQVAILNIIKEVGLTGFIAAVNGISYDQLCDADTQMQLEEDEYGIILRTDGHTLTIDPEMPLTSLLFAASAIPTLE